MPKITGDFTENETNERQETRGTQKPQKKHKEDKYRKKYKSTKKDCEKLSTKNKCLKQKMKHQHELHMEQKARYKAEGEAEAYKNIVKMLAGSKCLAELPEHVIEVEGEVRDA